MIMRKQPKFKSNNRTALVWENPAVASMSFVHGEYITTTTTAPTNIFYMLTKNGVVAITGLAPTVNPKALEPGL